MQDPETFQTTSTPEATPHDEALYDALTGLPNERYFRAALDEAVATAPGNFGILFFDLDGLKAANDTSPDGHSGGDLLLKNMAAVLQSQFRQEGAPDRQPDVVARLHGDEFAVLVRGTANSLLVHLVGAQRQEELEAQGIKTSVGAALHFASETADDTLNRADRAMYDNKRLRRREGFSPEQLGALAEIDDIANRYGIDLRQAVGAIDALRNQAER
jgi:diguanylate cyclase (GGDEF)-like protein